MIHIEDKARCCGCEACAQACPQNCIMMKPDGEGFLYPLIDLAYCIDCGMCEAVCPELNVEGQERRLFLNIYSAINRSDDLMSSSSGALFPLFARKVLGQNGVVFGAAFDDEWNVRHIAIETPEELSRLQGSKYVQSSTDGCYKAAREYLDAGRLVLFSGTACQINGLYCYLKKDYENLLTIDVLCHGVPSPLMWSNYVAELSNSYGSEPVSISFRDKSISWEDFSMKLVFADGREYRKVHREDPYMQLFLGNASLRPSCYACPFKNGHCLSDFTLGDAWGIRGVDPEMMDEKGVSVVVVNTIKGAEWMERVVTDSVCVKESNEHLLDQNQLYYRPVAQHGKREKVMQGLAAGKPVSSLARYIQVPLWRRAARKVKYIIK